MQVVQMIDTTQEGGYSPYSWTRMFANQNYTVPNIGHGVEFEMWQKGVIVRVKDVVHDANGDKVTVFLEPLPHTEEIAVVLKSVGFEIVED